MNSFSQTLEIILEQNSVESELSTSNSASQEVYSDCFEEAKNPLPAFATQSLEITFTTDTPCSTDLEEVVTVAPSDGKNPVSVLTHTYCEKMSHPHLFPSGKYSYKMRRDIPLSASKYFKDC